MTDSEIIAEAFEDFLKHLYANFARTLIDAKGDTTAELAAESKFRASVQYARHIRDRALANL